MIRLALVILVVLSSVGFFNPHAMVSEQLQKLSFFLSILLCFGYGSVNGVSLRGVKFPRTAFVLLLGGIGLSIIMASAFHTQSLKVSLIATMPYLFAYGFFFALMKLDVPRERLIQAYFGLAAVSTVVYFCNVATVPFNMFGEPIINLESEDRGIIRIPVVFIEFFPLLAFYAINRWMIDKKKKWFVIYAWILLMILLSVIRQVIALTLVLSLLFVMQKMSWKIKALTAAGVVAVVIWVLPLIPMYSAMIELSEKQAEENADEENVRIQSWRYYTYEHQTNALSPIFGNGMPSFGNSRWGIQFDSETLESGCFAADVGWAGFFWYFGGIATAALVYMLISAAVKKKRQENRYLTYWLVFVMITSFASGPPLYYWQIVDIVMCLYLVYKKDDDSALITSAGDSGDAQPRLSYLPKFPQLSK
ncbi:MAG: hypothetical protein K2N16_08135 [Muribaculaceae bacterium]|nr:hypothetical protein [Muribaculaceae bacterium]